MRFTKSESNILSSILLNVSLHPTIEPYSISEDSKVFNVTSCKCLIKKRGWNDSTKIPCGTALRHKSATRVTIAWSSVSISCSSTKCSVRSQGAESIVRSNAGVHVHNRNRRPFRYVACNCWEFSFSPSGNESCSTNEIFVRWSRCPKANRSNKLCELNGN